ncbi:hypothetical protein [Lacticaseibacillus zhaodongensis]|uniref:hypothetical protein n=1 Tax=Lacticaseibacillus zhaodongensis TaxID=2668065 RepID=UPI001E60293E|nr:hypothetical protein [Lacticaseibacillus zhaodongensis]
MGNADKKSNVSQFHTPVNPYSASSSQKRDNGGGGDGPMDKYVTKKHLRHKLSQLESNLDKSIDSKIDRAALKAIKWTVGTAIAIVAATSGIVIFVLTHLK